MIREEAIKILKGAIKKPNTKDGYLGQALDMAIKALERETILDKIKAEIIELRSKQNVGVLECLDIIDKYRAESEE